MISKPLIMDCTEFLELYSEYRDGLIADPVVERRLSQHLHMCRRCQRYDARLARAVTVLRSFSDIEPSQRFRRSLRGRLTQGQAEVEPVMPGSAGLMVGLMVATAVALLFWSGTDRSPVATVAVEEVQPARPPLPAAIAHPGMPFVSFADLKVPGFGLSARTPGATDQVFVTLTSGAQ